ncbi:MAG: carbon monoxide dehydrogenase subunit G [Bacteroidia bacterium]|nr:carbon monoxide dehydrogenase subunit G [Bacteroidia bacterium]
MHLEGSHLLSAPAQEVWDKLQNPEILAKVTPGIKKLDATGENTYLALSEIKIGPMNGSFKGVLEVAEQNAPESFMLIIKQNSKIGNVKATGTIRLEAKSESQTEVFFSGDAKISGLLARTGQRIISGVANTLTKQFFKNLEDELGGG